MASLYKHTTISLVITCLPHQSHTLHSSSHSLSTSHYMFFPYVWAFVPYVLQLGRSRPSPQLFTWCFFVSPESIIIASEKLSLIISPTTTQLFFKYSEHLLVINILCSHVYYLSSPHQNIIYSRAETQSLLLLKHQEKNCTLHIVKVNKYLSTATEEDIIL